MGTRLEWHGNNTRVEWHGNDARVEWHGNKTRVDGNEATCFQLSQAHAKLQSFPANSWVYKHHPKVTHSKNYSEYRTRTGHKMILQECTHLKI